MGFQALVHHRPPGGGPRYLWPRPLMCPSAWRWAGLRARRLRDLYHTWVELVDVLSPVPVTSSVSGEVPSGAVTATIMQLRCDFQSLSSAARWANPRQHAGCEAACRALGSGPDTLSCESV